MSKIYKIKVTERGWGGHFIGCRDCLYHRNTLIEYEDMKVVVSTVGRYLPLSERSKENSTFDTIGHNRYFETMAFIGKEFESGYIDADVEKHVKFNSNWELPRPDMEKEADEMHDAVVSELMQDLINGTLTIDEW